VTAYVEDVRTREFPGEAQTTHMDAVALAEVEAARRTAVRRA
jgi:hypothetical protein